MTFPEPPELPRILTLQADEVMVETQHWEEEHLLTIWFPEPIPLLELTIRDPLSEESQLPQGGSINFHSGEYRRSCDAIRCPYGRR